MSYDEADAFIEAFPPSYESDGERAADHQKTLDVLYLVGNHYDMRLDHVQLLCDVAGIGFEEMCKYAGGKSCRT